MLQQKHNKKSKNEITNDVNSVMSEELASKIADNARLNAALDEVDKKYEEKIFNLVSTIQNLEHQLSKNAQKDRAEDTKQKELIQGSILFPLLTVVLIMYFTAIRFPSISQDILQVSKHSIYHKETL